MGACEYQHYQGHKLSQRNLDNKAAEGWTIVSHHCSQDEVHTYVFKRMKP